MLGDGHDVVGLDDLSAGTLDNLTAGAGDPRFAFERLDVTGTGLGAFVERVRPEAVLHLAAQIDVRVSVADPLLDARRNVLGTVNLLEAARRAGVRKVVFASSGGSIYGSPHLLPVTEAAPVAPESPYAAGKVAGELYLHVYGTTHGLAWTSLALGNVYGPRQDPHGEAGVVAIFGTAMLEGRRARIFGDGTATRDYVYVGDVADAFARACPVGAADRRRLNIGTGVETPVRALHTLMAAAVGVPDDPELAPPRRGELAAIALDAGAAAALLGWRPRVALDEGVGRTLAWLRTKVAAPA